MINSYIWKSLNYKMDWQLVGLGGLIFLAVFLIFVEIFLIPGATFFGIGGAILLIVGLWGTYSMYDATHGNIAVAGSVLTFFILFIVGKKLLSKDKVYLKDAIISRVNEIEAYNLTVGDTGKAITTIRPSGKAKFGDHKVEVFSIGSMIDNNTPIEIAKISGNKIIVKPLKS